MPKLQSVGGTHDASTKNIFLKAWQLLEAGEMEEMWGEAEETHGRRFCWGHGWRCGLRTHARGGTSLRGLQPATHARAAEKIQGVVDENSKKPRTAERSRCMQDPDPMHCLSPHQRNWGEPRVTHGKKQGKFVLEADGGEVFPLGVR